MINVAASVQCWSIDGAYSLLKVDDTPTLGTVRLEYASIGNAEVNGLAAMVVLKTRPLVIVPCVISEAKGSVALQDNFTIDG